MKAIKLLERGPHILLVDSELTRFTGHVDPEVPWCPPGVDANENAHAPTSAARQTIERLHFRHRFAHHLADAEFDGAYELERPLRGAGEAQHPCGVTCCECALGLADGRDIERRHLVPQAPKQRQTGIALDRIADAEASAKRGLQRIEAPAYRIHKVNVTGRAPVAGNGLHHAPLAFLHGRLNSFVAPGIFARVR